MRGWAAAVVLAAAAVPLALAPTAGVGLAALAAAAGTLSAWHPRWRRAAASAPVAVAAALALAALAEPSRVTAVPVLVVTALVSAHLVLLDGAEFHDPSAVRSAALPLVLGGCASVAICAAASLPSLPWLWLPVLGGAAGALAFRVVTSGLRGERTD